MDWNLRPDRKALEGQSANTSGHQLSVILSAVAASCNILIHQTCSQLEPQKFGNAAGGVEPGLQEAELQEGWEFLGVVGSRESGDDGDGDGEKWVEDKMDEVAAGAG